jgi:hypothetical protein
VGGGDRVVLVIGRLSAANNVSPHDANLVTGVDIDDFARDGRMEAAVASKVSVVDVQDGVVGVPKCRCMKSAMSHMQFVHGRY